MEKQNDENLKFYNAYTVDNSSKITMFKEYSILEIELDSIIPTYHFEKYFCKDKYNKWSQSQKIFSYDVYNEPSLNYKGTIETYDDKIIILLPFKINPRCLLKGTLKIVFNNKCIFNISVWKFVTIEQQLRSNLNMFIDPVENLLENMQNVSSVNFATMPSKILPLRTVEKNTENNVCATITISDEVDLDTDLIDADLIEDEIDEDDVEDNMEDDEKLDEKVNKAMSFLLP